MTTAPTASPELLDLDKLEALARAATPGPWSLAKVIDRSIEHLCPVDRDRLSLLTVVHEGETPYGAVFRDEDAKFMAGIHPEQVLALIALARRAQPDGEASLVEGDAIARSKRILHLVDEYAEQQTAGRRTALRCALMDQFSRDITPHQLLEVARATGLRQFLHGVNATDARQLLADFVAAVPAAACGVQQAAAPGALEKSARALAEKWHKDAVDTGFATSEAAVELLEVLDAATSAPGTPKAPSHLMQALTNGIPLKEPVSLGKALWAQREARAVLSGGTGPVAAVHLVNIGLTGWVHTKETAEAWADGYNTALKQYRSVLRVLATPQRAAGQEGSESNG